MDRDPVGELMERYEELFADEPGLSLERFLERVCAGEFGRYERRDIARFLRAVEAHMTANIDTMVEANPHLLPLRDERLEEVQRMIAALLQRFAPDKAGTG